jgi:hypothetical protein
LARKLEDENFLQIVREYDVLCLSECWVKCPNDFNLNGYEKKYLFRNKCNGGGVVIFYKKPLSQYIKIVKCCADSMIWLKFDKSFMLNTTDLYMCAIYIPPDRNVFIGNISVTFWKYYKNKSNIFHLWELFQS